MRTKITIPEMVKRLRENMGLTVPQFAELLGVDRGTAYRYESDKFVPRPQLLVKLFRLAAEHEEASSFAAVFLEPIAEESGLPIAGICLVALMQVEDEYKLPDVRKLKTLVTEANLLLGNE